MLALICLILVILAILAAFRRPGWAVALLITAMGLGLISTL